MTTNCASLADELQHDFSRARVGLAEARLHQAEKDTLATRAAVACWLSFIDAVLDMYLDTVAPGGPCTPRRGTCRPPATAAQRTGSRGHGSRPLPPVAT